MANKALNKLLSCYKRFATSQQVLFFNGSSYRVHDRNLDTI